MSAIAARKARLALLESSRSASEPTILDGNPGPSTLKEATSTSNKRKSRLFDQTVKRRSTEKALASDKASHIELYHSSPVQADLVSDDNEEADSSDASSDSSSIVEEPNIEDEAQDDIPYRPSFASIEYKCCTFAPIRTGPLKNWHVETDDANGTSLYLGLSSGQTLIFVGKASIRVIDGQCNLACAELTSQHRTVTVFAPQNCPLPVLQASTQINTCVAMPQCGFAADCFTVILKIDPIHDTSIHQIAKACPLVRPNAFSPHLTANSHDVKGFHPILAPSNSLTICQTPSSWSSGLNAMQITTSTSICLVKGPKRVGKSTFSRCLLNRMVSTKRNSVAFLETDLGQTEFGPPGLVALYHFDSSYADVKCSSDLIVGPSWASLKTPLKNHFIGDVTPRNDPRRYIAAIADLLHHYKNTLLVSGVSLIINTQGWIKGLGADLLQEIELLAEPTHIFEFVSSEEDTQWSKSIANGDDILPHLFRLDAISTQLTRDRGLNAVEMRMLNLISYFYSTHLPKPRSILGHEEHSGMLPRWDFSQSLLKQRPFIVDTRQGLTAGIHVLPFGSTVSETHKLMALNGSCVAIVSCEIEPEETGLEEGEVSAWKKVLSKKLPDLQKSRCLALAIVRSIDIEKGQVHLLSPLSIHQLQLQSSNSRQHLCLVKGAIDIPIWLSLSFQLIEASQLTHDESFNHSHLEGVPLSEVPYLNFPASNLFSAEKDPIIGSEKRKIRRNILRRSQK